MKTLNSKWLFIFSVLLIAMLGYADESPCSQINEKQFKGLSWGMSENEFSRLYTRSEHIVMVPAPKPTDTYYQDIDISLYGLKAITGFNFGYTGLNHIVCSFLFKVNGKRLIGKDILRASDNILNSIKQKYGNPKNSFPWNGNDFMYIWVLRDTIIMFAWDSDDSWGIQYRSIEHDPKAVILLQNIKSN